MITWDPEFQRTRQISKIRNPPGNALEGFAIGSRHFLADCKSALVGVVVRIKTEALGNLLCVMFIKILFSWKFPNALVSHIHIEMSKTQISCYSLFFPQNQPRNSINDSGFVGVFPGIGKGFVGLIAKFAVGFMDFFQDVSEGFRASSNPHRVYPIKGRLPRHIGLDRVLQEFNDNEATYSEVLRTVDHNRYIYQTYVASMRKSCTSNPIHLVFPVPILPPPVFDYYVHLCIYEHVDVCMYIYVQREEKRTIHRIGANDKEKHDARDLCMGIRPIFLI